MRTTQRAMAFAQLAVALFSLPEPWRNTGMAGLVTIASIRAHGLPQLLAYCFGKREGG